jgi:hypothetical protein
MVGHGGARDPFGHPLSVRSLAAACLPFESSIVGSTRVIARLIRRAAAAALD